MYSVEKWDGYMHVYVLTCLGTLHTSITILRDQDDVTGSIVRERFRHFSFQSPITVPHSLPQYTPINCIVITPVITTVCL